MKEESRARVVLVIDAVKDSPEIFTQEAESDASTLPFGIGKF